MTDSGVDSTYRVPDEVLIQNLPSGEIVFLDLGSESYFGLDPVGAAMYTSLREHGSLDRAIESLLAEYEVDADTLRRDLTALCEQLVERGLLAKVE